MDPSQAIAATAGAYLLGSIPTAYLIARFAAGVDIRQVGSGNVGAVNTFKQAGVAVLLIDTLKGALAITLPGLLGTPEVASYLSAVAVTAGHNWPIFLGFRGGKGAATVMGVSLAVLPWLTLISLAAAIPFALMARNVVVGAALGFLVLNLLTVATGQAWAQVMLCLLLTAIVTGTYFAASRHETLTALRHRRWRELFSFE